MIATHNSFTYYEPRHKFFNLFKWLWKCQDMPIYEQLKFGDFIDIRIRIDGLGLITFCHGIVDLNVPCTLSDVLYMTQDMNKGCRIVIEKGIEPTPDFMNFVTSFDCVQEVIVKKGWRYLFKRNNTKYEHQCDRFYIPIHSGRGFWYNLKHFRFSTPRIYAKRNNPKNIVVEYKEDDTFLYWFDFYHYGYEED